MQWGDRWLVADPPLGLRLRADHGAIEQVVRCTECGETLSVFDIEYHYEPTAVRRQAQKESDAGLPDGARDRTRCSSKSDDDDVRLLVTEFSQRGRRPGSLPFRSVEPK